MTLTDKQCEGGEKPWIKLVSFTLRTITLYMNHFTPARLTGSGIATNRAWRCRCCECGSEDIVALVVGIVCACVCV